MGELIALRYIGEGAYRPDVPARDMDRADIAGLTEGQRAAAIGSGLYESTFEPGDDPDATATGEPAPTRHELLESLTKAELLEIAAEQGIEDVTKKTTNPDLVAAIEANETRLADEAAAAAATTSSDGEGDQGGDATPGDDPDATATGESGTPPDADQG